MEVDPVALNILRQMLDVITEEMGLNMMRTARSPIFSEAHDFSCYITDAQGQLIARRDEVWPSPLPAGTQKQRISNSFGEDPFFLDFLRPY